MHRQVVGRVTNDGLTWIGSQGVLAVDLVGTAVVSARAGPDINVAESVAVVRG